MSELTDAIYAQTALMLKWKESAETRKVMVQRLILRNKELMDRIDVLSKALRERDIEIANWNVGLDQRPVGASQSSDEGADGVE